MIIDKQCLHDIKLHNVEMSYAMENRIDIDCIDFTLCNEKPEIHVISESSTASILLKHYIYRDGSVISHIDIPLFVFRNSSDAIEVKPLSASFSNKTDKLEINGEYLEYQTTHGYVVCFLLENLLFANKYIFGVYWKDYISRIQNAN